MELARLANEEPAIVIVIDKDTRTKVAMTSVIDREQIFRCMTRPPEKLIEPFNSGAATAFQRFNASSRGLWLIVAVGLQCQTKRVCGPQDQLFRYWVCTGSPAAQGISGSCEQGFRSCLGILRQARAFGVARLEPPPRAPSRSARSPTDRSVPSSTISSTGMPRTSQPVLDRPGQVFGPPTVRITRERP